MTVSLRWDDVLARRCRQQLPHRPAEAADPVFVARTLAGVPDTGGWISPVVAHRGRVAGPGARRRRRAGRLAVTP